MLEVPTTCNSACFPVSFVGCCLVYCFFRDVLNVQLNTVFCFSSCNMCVGCFCMHFPWKTLNDRNWVVLSLKVEGLQAWRNTVNITKLCMWQNYVDYNLLHCNTLNISEWELQNLGGGEWLKHPKDTNLLCVICKNDQNIFLCPLF